MWIHILYILLIIVFSGATYFITLYINNKKWKIFIDEIQKDIEENYYTIRKAELESFKEWVDHHTFE
jgi:hypothetical protein